ncbi:MAG: DUF4349 domain-containing protein [Clostridia bacterium]|nr:DUF4349 domain-containing protein [Clostridia bacterium]
MKHKGKTLIAALCAAALLLTALLGFAGCGAAEKSADYIEPVTRSYGAGDAAAEVVQDDFMENNSYAKSESAPQAAEGTDASPQAQEKIVRTFELTVRTESFDAYLAALKKAVAVNGGYLENFSVWNSSYSGSNRSASVTARIPAQNADAFLAAAGENGVITGSTESATNVTLQYVDLESRISAYKTEQTTLMELLKKAESLEDTLKIHKRLNEVNYQLENYTAQMRVLENRVSYSTVEMDISEVNRALVEEDGLGTRIKNRFLENWDALIEGLKNIAVGLIGGLPILLPLAAVIAVVIVVLVKVRKKRKAKKAAKSVAPPETTE